MTPPKRFGNIKDWHHFFTNYWHLSEVACHEMLNPKHPLFGEKFEIESMAEHKRRMLFGPAIFNFKHSLEILIKAIRLTLQKEDELNASYYSHNLRKLFEDLNNKFPPDVVEAQVKKAIENSHELASSFFQEILESHQTYLEKFEKLIYKYQHLTFLNKKIHHDYILEDTDNDFFRYPVNKVRINVDYFKTTKKISEADVQELLEDIKNVRAFSMIYLALLWGRDDIKY